MEDRKKLKMPSGNIHDIRYLYNIVAGLKSKGGVLELTNKTFEHFSNLINNYNQAKASKYGLSFSPKEVNIKVVKHIISELIYLNLVKKEKGFITLTDNGENIASLIEKKNSIGLKITFTKMMLERFTIFEFFLKRIKEISNGNGVPIPFISSEVFDKCNGDPKKIGEEYIGILRKYCSNIKIQPENLLNSLENANLSLIEQRTEMIKKLQAIIEKYIVSEAFAPNIQNRRSYDFVRSRTSFLELTNYATFNLAGFKAELSYLISDFYPTDKYSKKILEYSGGKIYINSPTFEEISQSFRESITRIYNIYIDDFGYVKIADLRDMVCFDLKISDNQFDTFIKKMYENSPHLISFTYSGAGDKVTEKRLPIIFEKPMREFFTILKLNPGR